MRNESRIIARFQAQEGGHGRGVGIGGRNVMALDMVILRDLLAVQGVRPRRFMKMKSGAYSIFRGHHPLVIPEVL